MKRMSMILLLLAACLAVLCACAKTQEQLWEEQYDLGVRYLSEGNYEEAIIAFTAAIEIDPKQTDAYIGLADVYTAQGDIKMAINTLQEGFAATGDPSLRSMREGLLSSHASVDLTIDRQHLYYTSELTGAETRMAYDLVTVEGDGPRIRRINRAIQEDFEDFKTAGGHGAHPRWENIADKLRTAERHEWMYSYLNAEGYNDPSFMPCEVSAFVDCNENGILSIRYVAHYIYDYHCEYGMTFDLLTGEQLSYTEYFAQDMGAIRNAVRARLQTILDEEWAMYLDAVESALENNFDFSTLDFYIQKNELIVCSPRIGAGDGTTWTTEIHTGVYIDEWELEDAGPAVVSFERKDHSILNPDGSVSVELYYDLPVLEGNAPRTQRINRFFEKDYKTYESSISNNRDTYIDFANSKWYPDDVYLDTLSAEVTYNRDNILSVLQTSSMYMGGVFDNGYYGRTFDLETGRRLGLRDLFSLDAVSLLVTIKAEISNFVARNTPDGLHGSKPSIIAAYTLDDLGFYIAENGELIICIPEYELADGATGALRIPCKLYVARD